MSKVAFPQLFLIDMVIDIDGFFSYIAPKLLDELPRHPARLRWAVNQCLQQYGLKRSSIQLL